MSLELLSDGELVWVEDILNFFFGSFSLVWFLILSFWLVVLWRLGGGLMVKKMYLKLGKNTLCSMEIWKIFFLFLVFS